MASRYYDDDPDAPQPMDLDWADAQDDDEAGDDVVPCPTCGTEVHVLAQRCPSCGSWLDSELLNSPAARRARGWFWPIMIALLIAVIFVVWLGL